MEPLRTTLSTLMEPPPWPRSALQTHHFAEPSPHPDSVPPATMSPQRPRKLPKAVALNPKLFIRSPKCPKPLQNPACPKQCLDLGYHVVEGAGGFIFFGRSMRVSARVSVFINWGFRVAIGVAERFRFSRFYGLKMGWQGLEILQTASGALTVRGHGAMGALIGGSLL